MLPKVLLLCTVILGHRLSSSGIIDIIEIIKMTLLCSFFLCVCPNETIRVACEITMISLRLGRIYQETPVSRKEKVSWFFL